MSSSSMNGSDSTLVHTGTHGIGMDSVFYGRLVRNRRVDDTTFYPLLVTYILLMMMGTISNGLVIWVGVRHRSQRCLHQLLMINLALSDLLLSLVTMPLTLMEIVAFSWPLGNYPFMCRLTGCLEAISVYVSTLTIVAIATDRYHLIVHPSRERMRALGGTILVLSIWLISICLAAPLYMYRSLIHLPLNQMAKLTPLSPSLLTFPIQSLDYCIEQWPSRHAAFLYSVASIIVQFVVPVSILIVAHAGICRKLHSRLRTSASALGLARADADVAKTHQLLTAITCTFCLCWMPLNLFNLAVDFFGPFDWQEWLLTVLAVCHLAGVSSACFNPLYYGWLSQKFQQDLLQVLPCFNHRRVEPKATALLQVHYNNTGEIHISLRA